MTTALVETALDVAKKLNALAATEGRAPGVIGVHSLERTGHGRASLWLDLDNPFANAGTGVLTLNVAGAAVAGLTDDEIIAALLGDDATTRH